MGSYTFHGSFHQSLYGGAGSAAATLGRVVDVALGGHPYQIDWKAETPLTHTTVPIMREQSDDSDSPGEQTINPEALWRRSAESWHLGAGQEDLDRAESTPFRFDDSKGIDIWTRWKFSLLSDTEEARDSSNTNLYAAVAGDRLYITDGNDILFTTDLTSFTALTGIPVDDPRSITSDGFHIWTAHGPSGVYRTDNTLAATTSFVTGTVSLIRYVAGRVMAAEGPDLYDISTEAFSAAPPSVLPAAHYTHANSDWQWVDMAESAAFIFAAGFSGDKSQIYSIAIKDDATTLDAPVVVAELPHGEIITCLQSYIGLFLFIGTNRGWRFATAGPDGTLTISALISTPNPVLSAIGFGEFMWYGLTDFDSTSTGLGRLSTALFSDPENLVPAYASDLMTTGQGDVTSIVRFNDLIVYAVSGDGFYNQHPTNLVPSGHIDSGLINFGMTEPKYGLFFEVTHEGENNGSIEAQVSTPGLPFTSIGSSIGPSVNSSSRFALGEVTSAAFNFRLILSRDPSDSTLGQQVSSWLFLAQPRPKPSLLIYATIILSPKTETHVDTMLDTGTYSEVSFIRTLWENQAVTIWQQGNTSWSVFVEDFDLPIHRLLYGEAGDKDFNGSMLLKMKVIA